MKPLKKDPAGIYSGLRISPDEALKKYTREELKDIRRRMSNLEVEVDAKGSSMEEVYETYGPDWEIYKKRLDDEINAQESQKKASH